MCASPGDRANAGGAALGVKLSSPRPLVFPFCGQD